MYHKFWFDGDFFVRNLDASVELRQYQSLSPRIFSFFNRMVLFLFSLGLLFFPQFFHQGISSAFDLSISKADFPIGKELSRQMRDVNKMSK